MPQEVYRIMHVVGLALAMAAIGAAAGGMNLGEAKKKAWAWMHGIGLALLIVAGFGLMEKTDVEGYPLWIIIKLAMSIALGAALTIAYKAAPKRPILAILIPLLFIGIALYAAKYLRPIPGAASAPPAVTAHR